MRFIILRTLSHLNSQNVVMKASSTLLNKMGLIHVSEMVPEVNDSIVKINYSDEIALELNKNLFMKNYPAGEEFTSLTFLSKYVLTYIFQQMNWFNRNIEDSQIAKKYVHLYTTILEMLKNFDTQSIISLEDLKNKKQEFINEHPTLKAHVDLLWQCVFSYPDVLTGKRSHMEVMFPNGSSSLVQGIYQGNAMADYFNHGVALSIKAYINQLLISNPKAEINLLELGAGTGGTSQFVLEALNTVNTKINYYFTDISLAFLKVAEERWRDKFPWVTFKKLDIEKSPTKQDFSLQSIDLIFATNVVHATKKIDQTLKNIKSLLKPNGILILNEIVHYAEFLTLTFGLTEGWWLFEDDTNRIPSSPLLNEQQWQDKLRNAGFAYVNRIDQATGIREQAIFVCQNANFSQMVNDAAEVGGISKVDDTETMKGSILETDIKKVDEKLITQASSENFSTNDMKVIENTTEEFLKEIFSRILKIEKNSINSNQTFENYGIDSLLSLEIKNELSAFFEDLPETLLFEYMTIKKLASYLIENHLSTIEQQIIHKVSSENLIDKPILANQPAATNQIAAITVTASQTISAEEQKPISTEASSETHFIVNQDIAIIGCVGRYAGANDLNEFWDLLKQGKSEIEVIPSERWNWQLYFDDASTTKPGKSYSKWGSFIKDADKFDPLFFNISPNEAELIDPQERIILEMSWAVLEDAGYTRRDLEKIDNKVGFFVGVMNHDYSLLSPDSNSLPIRTSYWSIANRISYFFNLFGPSLAVDTACSSSLTAIHLAVKSLRTNECKLAMVAGVNLILHPSHYSQLCQCICCPEKENVKHLVQMPMALYQVKVLEWYY